MHKWEVTATQDEESFFDDHIETIIASDEALPPREQSLGETAVRWDRVGKDAFIQAQGGSVDDRILARAMVAEQLRSFGVREAEYSLDDWDDLEEEPEGFSTFYHVAPAAAESDILQHGIDWQRRVPQSQWRTDSLDFEEYPEGNYMWTHPEAAKVEHQRGPNRHLWEVRYPHSYEDELQLDPAANYGPGSEYERAVYTEHPLLPQWLRRIGGSRREAEYSFDDIRQGMAVTPEWWSQQGPFYHGTTRDKAERIMKEGLQPWDTIETGSRYRGWKEPRPGHVYLSPDPAVAWIMGAKNQHAGDPAVVLRIDRSALNAENINPDEDAMAHTKPWAGNPWAFDPTGTYQSRGDKAETEQLGNDPLESQRLITDWPAVAHRGPIPPQAISVHNYIHTSTMERTADWNDIMDKARRLIQDGRVRILRNGWNNIVAWVKGDHGEYQPEIFRQDPNSRAITMSDCGCGWGEFQNQPRTRQWKKFQDRPCAHILASYWLARATPLDEDAHPSMGDQGASQPQGQPGAPPGAMPPGGPQGAPQGAPAPMGPQQGIPPVSQPGISPQGGPSPADVLPQFQTEPPDIQPQNPSSVPGLRGPTPTNPINYPPGPGGTFSSWHEAGALSEWRVAADDTLPEVPEQDPRLTAPLVNGQMVQLRYPDKGIQQGRSEAHGAGQQTQLPAGLVGEVLGTDPTTGMVSVLYVGKPWDQNREFEPFGATGEHWRSYLIHRPDVKRPGPAYRRTR